MDFSMEEISPNVAEALLETNPSNRTVSHARVLYLANEMREGRWTTNGATIVIGKSGKLLDGQHRLYAIREYGQPVLMAAARNADDNAFETIDTGRSRSAGNMAGMEGIRNPNVSAASANLLWKIWHGISQDPH